MSRRSIVTAALGWPLVHVLVFRARFGRMPEAAGPLDYVWFGLTGLIAAWVTIAFMERATSPRQRTTTILGTLLAAPMAAMGNLGGGLLGPIGVVLFGTLPFVLGAWGGWSVGRRTQTRP